MVDLNKCQPGDKLRSKHGMILTYVGRLPESYHYEYQVKYPNGGWGSRTNDGYVFRNLAMRKTADHDIVEIIKE